MSEFDDIQETYYKLRNQFIDKPIAVEVSQKFYHTLRMLIPEREANYSAPTDLQSLGQIYGIEILIDPKLKDMEYEFRYRPEHRNRTLQGAVLRRTKTSY